MCAREEKSREEIKQRSRVTKEEADTEGIGPPGKGIRTPVPGYAEDDHTSFLGVDEPVVNPDDRGDPPPPVPDPTNGRDASPA